MEPLFGFLLVDKPAGMTSHDVVDKTRRSLGIRAVGHAGTLDPFATGLLILGIGKATKLLAQLVGLDKEYVATARLGATSDTYDREGKIEEKTIELVPTMEQINQVLDQFRGGYDQLAPLFSAKKIKGKKLYELARAGETDQTLRPMKHVQIDQLTVESYQWPELTFCVHCSSGTYIRSLADDIGRELGTGAYLTELRRTKIGGFRVEEAVQIDRIKPESLLGQDRIGVVLSEGQK